MHVPGLVPSSRDQILDVLPEILDGVEVWRLWRPSHPVNLFVGQILSDHLRCVPRCIILLYNHFITVFPSHLIIK
jgi:hypothetical protein